MTSAAPWSHPVRLSEVQRAPKTLELEADSGTRARIAQLLDLAALERLEGRVQLAPWLDGARLTGRWSAACEQTCSVSAEDFPVKLAGELDLRLLPADSPHAPSPEAELAVDPEAPDPPDVLEGETIDVGAYLVEALALELDPFPRAPGAEFKPLESETEPSPFAALAALKRDG